jgi:hypothetical protein
MNPDRDLAGPEVGGGLLVGEARDHKGKDLAFPRRKKRATLLQLGQLGSLPPPFSIKDNCGVDRT